MSERRPDFVTYSGISLLPWDLKLQDIRLEDIAHHLSNLCRFTGAVREFYSVAQHSCLVAVLVEDSKLKLPALLHDAAEAYWNDLCTPIKHHGDLHWYAAQEKECQKRIYSAFGIGDFDYSAIKEADNRAFEIESASLIRPYTAHPMWCRQPKDAKSDFLIAFDNFNRPEYRP